MRINIVGCRVLSVGRYLVVYGLLDFPGGLGSFVRSLVTYLPFCNLLGDDRKGALDKDDACWIFL